MADIWALKILSGPHIGAEITLDPGTWTLGRHDECDLVLTDSALAERQFELSVSPEGVQVTCLAQGGHVYIAGQPQPQTFSLAPHTVAMSGSLYFAIGQIGQPWPELNLGGSPMATTPPPAVTSDQSEPGESSRPAQESEFDANIPMVDDKVDDGELKTFDYPEYSEEITNRSSPSKFSQRLKNVNLLRWCQKHPLIVGGSAIGLFMSFLVGGFIWLWMMTDPENAAPSISSAHKVERIIRQMDIPNIELQKLPDGSIMISGYIADNTIKNLLQQALNTAKVPYSLKAIVMNEMRATAVSVLERYGFKQMSVELDTTPGSLILNGYAITPKEVSRISKLLKQEVHGLIAIIDQVQYQAIRMKTLRSMLKERNIFHQIRLFETPGKVALQGRLTDAAQGYHLKEVVQNFREKYKNQPKLEVNVTLPATDLVTMQPQLDIKSISLGQIPYVILDNGEKYLRGAKLKNGYILEGINLEYLTLKLGRERIKYFIGGGEGSHGGQ